MMMTMTILLIAAIVILWQFSSGLWLFKIATTTTKQQMIYLPIPPHEKLVFTTPRRSVPWQEQVQHPRSSWQQLFKSIQAAISFQGTYTTQRRWSGKTSCWKNTYGDAATWTLGKWHFLCLRPRHRRLIYQAFLCTKRMHPTCTRISLCYDHGLYIQGQ